MVLASRTFIVIVSLVCIFDKNSATDFSICNDETPPISLDVEGCSNQPCNFYKGHNAVMSMKFEVDHDVNNLTASVHAHIAGVKIPYPLPQPNACLGLVTGECPLDSGEEVTYKLEMPVQESFPQIQVLIEFNLKDENKNVIVCFKLKAKVTKETLNKTGM